MNTNYLSVVVSSLAFLVSLTTLVLTQVQKKFETERTLRFELSDVIGKLNSVFEQFTKLAEERAAASSTPAVVNLRSFYNGQKLFYARQAMYIVDKIPHLVSDAEYNSIARAFVDVDDDTRGLQYYKKAIAAAPGPFYKATNLRGYGRLLIRIGMLKEGRAAFTEALSLVPAESDSALWFRAETFGRWAAIEAGAGESANVTKLLSEASDAYSAIRFAPRRSEGLSALTALQNSLKRSPANTGPQVSGASP